MTSAIRTSMRNLPVVTVKRFDWPKSIIFDLRACNFLCFYFWPDLLDKVFVSANLSFGVMCLIKLIVLPCKWFGVASLFWLLSLLISICMILIILNHFSRFVPISSRTTPPSIWEQSVRGTLCSPWPLVGDHCWSLANWLISRSNLLFKFDCQLAQLSRVLVASSWVPSPAVHFPCANSLFLFYFHMHTQNVPHIDSWLHLLITIAQTIICLGTGQQNQSFWTLFWSRFWVFA